MVQASIGWEGEGIGSRPPGHSRYGQSNGISILQQRTVRQGAGVVWASIGWQREGIGSGPLEHSHYSP